MSENREKQQVKREREEPLLFTSRQCYSNIHEVFEIMGTHFDSEAWMPDSIFS